MTNPRNIPLKYPTQPFTPCRLLKYKQVREMLGCDSNGPINAAVKAGHLIRVCVGKSTNSFRITAESAIAFQAARTHYNDAEEIALLARAREKTAQMSKARRLPLPEPGEEILFDPVQITKGAQMGVALRDPETWDHYRNKPREVPVFSPTPGVTGLDGLHVLNQVADMKRR